jgi:hypothetical protein
MHIFAKLTVFCFFLLSNSYAFALVENNPSPMANKSNTQIPTQKLRLNLNDNKLQTQLDKKITNNNKIALIRFKQIQRINNFSGEVLYQYGRFSAQSNITQNKNHNISYYLQSSLLVFNSENIAVSLEAKIESIENSNINAIERGGKNNKTIHVVNLNRINQKTFYNVNSLGVVGSYSINKNWRFIGTLTSQKLNDNLPNTILGNNTREEKAIIKTSYSF